MSWWSLRPGPEREAAKAASERPEPKPRPKHRRIIWSDTPIDEIEVDGVPALRGPSGIAHSFTSPAERYIVAMAARTWMQPFDRERFSVEPEDDVWLMIRSRRYPTNKVLVPINCYPGIWQQTYEHLTQTEAAERAAEKANIYKEDNQWLMTVPELPFSMSKLLFASMDVSSLSQAAATLPTLTGEPKH